MVIQINQIVLWKTGGVTDNKSENMRETIFGAQMEQIKKFVTNKNHSFFSIFYKKYFPIYFSAKNIFIS